MSDEAKRRVAHWVRTPVRELKAYAVPSAANLIKLDAMENPYPWSPELRAAWVEVLRDVSLNRYPDPRAQTLSAGLRDALAVPAGAELMLGNGSDELIQIILLALAQPGRAVLAPVPTFVMYELLATVAGMRFVGVPLRADFTLDRDAMLLAIAREQPAVVFIAYPNNPTGDVFPVADIEAIINASPGLVVIDEAYFAFAEHTFMARLAQYPQLVVMRTLSKQGLAGLRLGILAGHSAWLHEFDKIRLPYNINSLTQASAEFALRHRDVMDAQAAQIRRDRGELALALQALPGVQVYPSAANFILFRVPGSASAVHARLIGAGVLIKNLDHAHPLLAGCLRVTVGTPAENTAFLQALRTALA